MINQRSICKRYIVISDNNYPSDGVVIDTKLKITYEKHPTEINGKYYAKRHQTLGFTAQHECNDKYFIIRIGDCTEGKLIIGYTGNTIEKQTTVVFKKKRIK